ncbi:MAG: hypothetical protein ABSG33_05190 [Candidatus Bathyarchaeia archaeon]
MPKHHTNHNQALIKLALALFLLTLLTYAASTTPNTKAQTTGDIYLSPASGPIGSTVTISGDGFTGSTTITFGGTTVATITTQPNPIDNYPYLSGYFTVPKSATSGTSATVTATDAYGDSAQASFSVTSGSASTPTPSSSTSATPTPYQQQSGSSGSTTSYTFAPTVAPVQSSGFWSPLAIGAVVAVIALIIIISLLFMRTSGGGKRERERMLEREPMPYRSAPYGQPTQPTSPYNPPASQYGQSTSGYQSRYNRYSYASRYSQSPSNQSYSRPPVTSRYSQPSYGAQQSAAAGKTCPHCHRAVKGDYKICPYCYKKI